MHTCIPAARSLAAIVPLLTLIVGLEATAQSANGFATAASHEDAAYSARILRDTWGVPHVFGETDADAAFGIAYAHSEDDFKTIQEAMITGRSRLGSINGPDAAAIDFMVHLLGVWDDVNARYETDLSPETRAICEAYAAGINEYAAQHPEQVVLPDIYPVTGKDVVVGFAFRAPFFFGLDSAVLELFGPERRREISEKQALADFADLEAFELAGRFVHKNAHMGSNTFSIGPSRTPDGSTYLAINSHQPYTGPVAWYEAHIVSDEGWNMYGGLFPGMPLIGHGHNPDLGWAMTVNRPDLVDVYVLKMNPDNDNQYWYDGEWRDLESKEVTLKVKITPKSDMTMNVRREVLRSVHGPVVRADHGVYAIRYAGMGDIRQIEQWFRMNKARTQDDWLDAMRMQAIASLNVGYADKVGNIMYLYNARLPIRTPGYDYEKYLPGDTSETVWDSFLPFEQLPMVDNPPSGFVQNCNSTPFQTTIGEANPRPENYPESMGIEMNMTNRAKRALAVFGGDSSITWEEFHRYKYDMRYAGDAVVANVRQQLLDYAQAHPGELDTKALETLQDWDLSTHPESRGAALAIMTTLPVRQRGSADAPAIELTLESFNNAIALLTEKHGRVDPAWQEVNRLVRGDADLGIGGGPDILHAVVGNLDEETGRYIARTGDTLVILVRWTPDGAVHSEAIHQFGSATLDASSPHYNDQSPLFVQRKLRPVWMTESEIRANLEREYTILDTQNSGAVETAA